MNHFMPIVPGETYGLAPGEARCPGAPSVQEIMARDAVLPPPVMQEQSYRFLGDEDIPFERYTSRKFFDLEMERMWPRVWQWVCRLQHIPEIGDQYTYDIGPYSVLVVNTESGIKAFWNSCLHRGTKLRAVEGESHSEELRCPFHGWTWSLEGDLKRVPCAWDFPHVSPERFKLPEVRVGLWGGFVFINMDGKAPPLEDYLAPIPEHFRGWDLDKRYVEIHLAKELGCNWKTAYEAFIEAYHVFETHPQMAAALTDANTQYDMFSDNVSRFMEPSGVSSPHMEPLSDQELLDQMLVGDRSVLGDALTLREGETARIVMARFLRQTMGEKYRSDLSRFSDAEVLDVIEYSLFPNMFLFPGLSLPMVYRFRPIGMDPDRSLFEILFMRPVPDDGEPPPPAAVHRVTEAESYGVVPGMDPFLAHVYDQDTGNLRAQQEGFKTAQKRGMTLGNYQEARIRLFSQTLDKYLKEGV